MDIPAVMDIAIPTEVVRLSEFIDGSQELGIELQFIIGRSTPPRYE